MNFNSLFVFFPALKSPFPCPMQRKKRKPSEEFKHEHERKAKAGSAGSAEDVPIDRTTNRLLELVEQARKLELTRVIAIHQEESDSFVDDLLRYLPRVDVSGEIELERMQIEYFPDFLRHIPLLASRFAHLQHKLPSFLFETKQLLCAFSSPRSSMFLAISHRQPMSLEEFLVAETRSKLGIPDSPECQAKLGILALCIAIQLVVALHFLHTKRIAHGRVSTKSIMLGQVKCNISSSWANKSRM